MASPQRPPAPHLCRLQLTMRRIYTAMTARRAQLLGLRPSRSYGYVVRIDPPIESTSTGEDIEGIGWVPHWGGPRKHVQHLAGWYKHRDRAQQRAAELSQTTCSNLP